MGKSNLILIGMPACGKSTIGVVLAKTIQKGFVDTDISIQQREKKTLQEIINTHGNDYFHKVEEQVLMDFGMTDCVVATGGSAVYCKDAMEKLRENGLVVYIRISLETVLARLNNIKTRGVTLDKGETIADLYQKRVPLYEASADVVIEADNLSVEEAVEEIMKCAKANDIE